MRRHAALSLVFLAATTSLLGPLSGCSSDDDTPGAIATSAGGTAGTGGTAGAAQSGGAGGGGPALGGSGGASGAGTGGAGAGGKGGKAGSGGEAGEAGASGEAGSAGSGGEPLTEPTPESISFQAVNPLPSGEFILFNEWAASPNRVSSIRPDGSEETEIFRAMRVWSMGAQGDRVAFACGDPQQEAHYGTAIGDAIQHTWLYDGLTQTASVLAWGNINDECHRFSPDAASLFVCRRTDFDAMGQNKTYRIGRIDIGTREFQFLTPEADTELALIPEPLPGGASLIYTHVKIVGTQQQQSIRRLSFDGKPTEEIRAAAGRAALSPDGVHYAYQDYDEKGAVYIASLDTNDAPVLISSKRGASLTFSPDGTEVAMLHDEPTASCQHIDIVKVDGSEKDTPRRVLDCVQKSAVITKLAWVKRP
jgi:hypothetical protein